MKSLDNLDQQIKDVLLVNGGDIDIAKHPYIIKDAEELGLNQVELARRVRTIIVPSVDWAPYHKIDKMMVDKNILVKGSISEEEADSIVKAAEDELQRPQTENYIRSVLRKREFKTREKNNAEADSFRNLWMTDEAWIKYQREQTTVEWLGEKAHSLHQVAEISYRKKDEAKYYLRNTAYLVPIVVALTKSASKGEEFSKIIENEPNADKRFLKVIYRLNSKLPFSLQNEDFTDIYQLFKKTATDYNLYLKAVESFSNEHIHIWIIETDAVNADKLPRNYDYNSFLKFLYKVDKNHPFYLFTESFNSPEELIQKVNTNASYWNKLAEAMASLQLYMWFEGLGKLDWINNYYKENDKFINSVYHSQEDKKPAAVQTLIQTIDPAVPNPRIVSDQRQIQLLSAEGSRTIEHAIHLQLEKSGFVKAKLYLDSNVEGIRLNTDTAIFFGQDNMINRKVLLVIEALKLVKDKLYTLNIVVQTEYETLSIPVEIRVVFPKRAYYTQLIKYAVMGAAFFGGIRFLTGKITGADDWLRNEYNPDAYNYFAYFIALVLLIAGLIGSYYIIRKVEKI